MRLPNGFGCVYKASGKRRKPWIARITVDREYINPGTGKAYIKYRTLGSFKTSPEALACLQKYHDNPYSIEVESITFKEVYDKWKSVKFDKISDSNINGYKASYKTCEVLYQMRFIDIKTAHLQNIMDTCGKGHGTRRKLKVLFGQLYAYALQNDVINKNYAEFVEIGEKEDTEAIHKPFTENEIKLLWDNLDRMDFIDTILIMIYTGLRPGELVLIENKDINLEERYVRGGIKTSAGKNRIIPINKKIESLIKNRMNDYQFMLINHVGKGLSYYNYREEKFKVVMKQLGMDHLPHDGRHTFATLMDNAEANKVSIKRIMGHASKDVTDKVYTHKDITELIKAIDLI